MMEGNGRMMQHSAMQTRDMRAPEMTIAYLWESALGKDADDEVSICHQDN